jgi:serine/threonine protein kinase
MHQMSSNSPSHETNPTTETLGNANIPTNPVSGGALARRKTIQDKVKLINQGAYGCVYRPNIQCNGRPGKSKNFVSKLQQKSSSDNEVAIGTVLAKIPNFNYHFAPIIRSCPVQLSKLNPEYINACDVVKKDPHREFILNRIRFVGTETLEKYLSGRIRRGYFILKFFELHQYLIQSVALMVEQNIVHFDLKENNIIYDDKNHVPIIIDFGMSVNTTFLSGSGSNANTFTQYDTAFHIYYEKYPPWCLDIVLCSFLVQKSTDKSKVGAWANKQVNVDQLLRIVDVYFSENDLIRTTAMINPNAVAKSRSKWRQYVNTQCAGKTGKQVVDMIANVGWKSWDNFGMAVIFLNIWTKYKLAKMVDPTTSTAYEQAVVSLVTSIPGERPTVDRTIDDLYKITKILSKKSYLPSPGV